VYEAFRTCFIGLARTGTGSDKGNIIARFKEDTDLLPFLGMPDVEALRSELLSRTAALRRVESRLNGNEVRLSTDDYRRWTTEENELLRWFREREKGLVQAFRPYLHT